MKMKNSSLTEFIPYNLKDNESVKAGTILHDMQNFIRAIMCRGQLLGMA